MPITIGSVEVAACSEGREPQAASVSAATTAERGGAEPATAADCGPVRDSGPTGNRERTSAHRALHAGAARGRHKTAIVCCPA